MTRYATTDDGVSIAYQVVGEGLHGRRLGESADPLVAPCLQVILTRALFVSTAPSRTYSDGDSESTYQRDPAAP
jgi:hypothetical protein